ncbi:MAG: alanine racemase [Ilumatobacteraceae bacterium]|nr:alanine racemase [Ilumatobacteraceae bacterium]
MTSVDEPASASELPTPALVVDRAVFDRNCAAMDAVRPGRELRPHVKAFKSTALAAELAASGHTGFCAATPREIEGMAAAGLADDLLLANESLDVERLGQLDANVTVAVDSDAVLDAAIDGGIDSVLIDIDVGLPRCGCDVDTGARLADRARTAGLDVRGVMGYEGHLMMVHDRVERVGRVERAMATLAHAHDRIGGDIVSGGGTGTFDTNTWCTEIQAGSYCLMDTQYDELDLPFEQALSVIGTVISISPKGWIIADVGLKSLGMDHGNPTWDGPGEVFFCSDEHTTLLPEQLDQWTVGDRIALHPAHVDPTVARHEQMWVVDGDPCVGGAVLDRWPIDLRHW